MEALFLKLLNMSITASWLVLAVAVLRLLLRKAPKALRVVMWALVGIRLVLPFSFESILSLVPSSETVPAAIMYSQTPEIESGIPAVDAIVNPVISDSLAPAAIDSANPLQVTAFIATYVWLAGVAIMLLYTAVSYIRVHKKVREAAPLEGKIWLCDRISSPFILGVFRPRVYIPSSMREQDMEYVLAHENAHLKRRDHLWKPLGFLLLSVYWFNPILWTAYILLCRDIELACDEKVIKELGIEIKKPYSDTLINCSVSRKMISACPLAFGETGVKGRIKSVLNYKRPAFWIIIASVAACIVVSVCFLTDPPGGKATKDENSALSALKEKYPQFFDLDTTNGLTVFVWQMNSDSYSCVLLSGRDTEYTIEELLEIFDMPTATAGEMKAIISAYDISKDDITVYPRSSFLSSFAYVVDDAYRKKIAVLLGLDSDDIVTASPELTVSTVATDLTSGQINSVKAFRGSYTWSYDKGNGEMVSTIADSMEMLDCADSMTPLRMPITGISYTHYSCGAALNFDVFPDRITVYCWDLGSDAPARKNAELDDLYIVLQPNYLYEVVATWDSSDVYNGVVCYGFRTE